MNNEHQIRLPPRALAYLAGRAHGLSNQEVAVKCGVGEKTVEGGIRRALFKLDARNTAHAVFKATCLGLLTNVGDQSWQ